MIPNNIYLIYMNKADLVLDKQQLLICNKTKLKAIQTIYETTTQKCIYKLWTRFSKINLTGCHVLNQRILKTKSFQIFETIFLCKIFCII